MNYRRNFFRHAIAGSTAGISIALSASPISGKELQVGTSQRTLFDAVIDFFCDNSGASNTTNQIKAFYDACIASGTIGFIPAGIYLITEGVLAFDTNFQDKPWPSIYTAGHQLVIFKFAGASDLPLLTWSNGQANSDVGKYWIGGGHGGVSFQGANRIGFSQSHAICLVGVWGFHFGWLRGNQLQGDLVNLPRQRYGQNNPDPYACSFLEFEGLETNYCSGKAVRNNNSLGLTHCRVKRLRATNGTDGVWFGYGSAVEIDAVSIGSCGGWAFDDASYLNESDGPSSRFYIRYAELDNVQFGFRLNRLSMFDLNGIRFVHRFNVDQNKTKCYWPKISFDISGGKRSSVSIGKISCIHRLEKGGVKSDFGVFLTGNNSPNFSNCQIDQTISDQFNFGFSDHELFSQIDQSSHNSLTNAGRKIYDSNERIAFVFIGSISHTSIGFKDFGKNNSKINFKKIITTNSKRATELYDSIQSIFTSPHLGMYQIDVNIPMQLPTGTLVRIGISNSNTLLATSKEVARSGEIQDFQLRQILKLNYGEKIFVVAEQKSLTDVYPVVSFSQDEIRFSVVSL